MIEEKIICLIAAAGTTLLTLAAIFFIFYNKYVTIPELEKKLEEVKKNPYDPKDTNPIKTAEKNLEEQKSTELYYIIMACVCGVIAISSSLLFKFKKWRQDPYEIRKEIAALANNTPVV